MSWVNYSVYFFLGVLTYFVAKKDELFWDVYAHFSFTFFFTAFSVIIAFIGKKGIIGDNFTSHYLAFYHWSVFFTLFLVGATYLTFRYLFWQWPRWLSYSLSWTVSLLLHADFWYKAFTVARFPFKTAQLVVYHHTIRTDVAIILVLGLYCLVLLISHKPNGAFIHFLAAAVFISFICDIFDMMVSLYALNVYGLDQYFAFFCLLMLIAACLLRLLSLYSPEYRLREQFIFNPSYGIQTPIVLKSHNMEAIVGLIKSLFSSQNIIFQLALGLVFVLISGLTKSLYVTIKLFMMVVLVVLVWNVYYYFIYASIKDGQILNKRYTK